MVDTPSRVRSLSYVCMGPYVSTAISRAHYPALSRSRMKRGSRNTCKGANTPANPGGTPLLTVGVRLEHEPVIPLEKVFPRFPRQLVETVAIRPA